MCDLLYHGYNEDLLVYSVTDQSGRLVSQSDDYGCHTQQDHTSEDFTVVS